MSANPVPPNASASQVVTKLSPLSVADTVARLSELVARKE